MNEALLALGLAAVAAGGDVLGGLLASAAPRDARRWMTHLSAFGAGIILGTCFLSLIPEVLKAEPNGPLLIALGFLFVFIVENLFASRPPQVPGASPARELIGALDPSEPLLSRLASWIAFGGLSVHAFFDGVAIVVSWTAGVTAGLVTFLAVALHKLPEGVSIASIMLAAARTRRGALLAAGALAALTVAGALFTLVAASLGAGVGSVLLAFATGTLLYVVSADLLPMVNRMRSATAPISVGLGVALIYGVLALSTLVGLE